MTEQELNDILTKAQEMDALGTAQGDADRDRLLQMYQEGVEETQVTRGEDVRAAAKSSAIRGGAGALDLARNVLDLAQGGPIPMLSAPFWLWRRGVADWRNSTCRLQNFSHGRR